MTAPRRTPDLRTGTAIVTGAASGIGREIARQLARDGMHVLATDLPGTALEDAVAEMVAAGGQVTARVVDVTDPSAIAAAIDAVVQAHGRLDLMVNNAGIAIFGDYEAVDLDDWDRIIDVNLRGVAHGTTLAYRQMVEQGGGTLVITASAAGLVPVPLQAHYCATKHALLGLAKTLRLEARDHGVQVTVFCPAWVESGMFDNHRLLGSMAGADTRTLVPIAPLATDVAVARLLRGVRRGRRLVITPVYARVGWWLERLSPVASEALHRSSLGILRHRLARQRRRARV